MKEILSFMKEFNTYHHKHWFSSHKDEWKKVRSKFDEFMQFMVQKVGAFDDRIDAALVEDKKVYKIFRINRDIRFSKDKTPYKKNISGTITLGSMTEGFPGYYISIQPGDKSFVGGGIYMPDSSSLKRIRIKIDQSPETFRNILNKKSFKKMFPDGIETDLKVATVPRGYAKDNPAIELLRFKSFTAGRSFSDQEVISPDFPKEVVKTLKALYPLQEFLSPQKYYE